MKKILFIALLGLLSISKGKAQGHGQLFGLQTPTLAKGGFDFNAAAMSLPGAD